MSQTKLPWRTLVTGGPTGRFTREQIRRAVQETKAEREARQSRQKKQQRRK